MKTESPITAKYLDAEQKLLNPFRRDLAPDEGDKGFCMGVARSYDPATRKGEAVVSTASVDRYEEIVLPSSYREMLPRFMTNPIMLANHVSSSRDGKPTSIGKWTDIKIAKDVDPVVGLFDLLPPGDELTDAWAFRFQHGVQVAFSVGFIVREWEWREFPSPVDPNVNIRLRVFTKVELLEISAVHLPANQDALLRAASVGQLDGLNPVAALQRAIETEHAASMTRTLDQYFKQATEPGGRLDMFGQGIAERIQRSPTHGPANDAHARPRPRHVDDMAEVKRGLQEILGG